MLNGGAEGYLADLNDLHPADVFATRAGKTALLTQACVVCEWTALSGLKFTPCLFSMDLKGNEVLSR